MGSSDSAISGKMPVAAGLQAVQFQGVGGVEPGDEAEAWNG